MVGKYLHINDIEDNSGSVLSPFCPNNIISRLEISFQPFKWGKWGSRSKSVSRMARLGVTLTGPTRNTRNKFNLEMQVVVDNGLCALSKWPNIIDCLLK